MLIALTLLALAAVMAVVTWVYTARVRRTLPERAAAALTRKNGASPHSPPDRPQP